MDFAFLPSDEDRMLSALQAWSPDAELHAVGVVSAQVRGRAKRYPYWSAQCYRARETRQGYWIWEAEGRYLHTRRSRRLAENDAIEKAVELGCEYTSHSMHQQRVFDPPTDGGFWSLQLAFHELGRALKGRPPHRTESTVPLVENELLRIEEMTDDPKEQRAARRGWTRRLLDVGPEAVLTWLHLCEEGRK